MKRLIATLSIAASAFVGFAGISHAEGVSAPLTCTDAPEYMPVGACGPIEAINECNDGIPVTIDPVTGGIFGDQDANGRLDGDDCNWS